MCNAGVALCSSASERVARARPRLSESHCNTHLNADRALALKIELVLGEARKKVALAHTTVANEHDCREAAGRRVIRRAHAAAKRHVAQQLFEE